MSASLETPLGCFFHGESIVKYSTSLIKVKDTHPPSQANEKKFLCFDEQVSTQDSETSSAL
jgi:hypothetical protein